MTREKQDDDLSPDLLRRNPEWYYWPGRLGYTHPMYFRLNFERPIGRVEYEAYCSTFLEVYLWLLEKVDSRELMIWATQMFVRNEKEMAYFARWNCILCDLKDLAWIPKNLALFGDMVLLSLMRRDCPEEGVDPEAVAEQSRRIMKKRDTEFETALEDAYRVLAGQVPTGPRWQRERETMCSGSDGNRSPYRRPSHLLLGTGAVPAPSLRDSHPSEHVSNAMDRDLASEQIGRGSDAGLYTMTPSTRSRSSGNDVCALPAVGGVSPPGRTGTMVGRTGSHLDSEENYHSS